MSLLLMFVVCCVSARSLAMRDQPNDTDTWADDDDDTPIGKAVVMIPSDPDFMSKYPGVKTFVKKDLPLYHAVEVKSIVEDKTELRLYTINDQVSEAFDINDEEPEDIDDVLLEYGFFKRNYIDDEVPAKYLIYGTYDEYDHDEL